MVFVDGLTVGEIGAASLKDRRILRDEGFITVIVVRDSATGKIAVTPEIHARGFAEDQAVFDPTALSLTSIILAQLVIGTLGVLIMVPASAGLPTPRTTA